MTWSPAGMIFDPRLMQTGVIPRYAGKIFNKEYAGTLWSRHKIARTKSVCAGGQLTETWNLLVSLHNKETNKKQ